MLYLGYNRIEKIENLLPNLIELDLSHNKIKEIENSLPNLHKLNLIVNQIKELTVELCYLRNLTEFYKYNNPIEDIPLVVKM
jgi:Leucine-rich repeat (LRR) protein